MGIETFSKTKDSTLLWALGFIVAINTGVVYWGVSTIIKHEVIITVFISDQKKYERDFYEFKSYVEARLTEQKNRDEKQDEDRRSLHEMQAIINRDEHEKKHKNNYEH